MIDRRSFITLGGGAAVACRQVQAKGSNSAHALILPKDDHVRTGCSRMINIGGGHQVWTKKVGNAPTKVLLLHGGPDKGSHMAMYDDQIPCFKELLTFLKSE
jgi:proline iminopeptidase